MFRSTSSGEAPRISGLIAVFCPWSAESFLSRKTIRVHPYKETRVFSRDQDPNKQKAPDGSYSVGSLYP